MGASIFTSNFFAVFPNMQVLFILKMTEFQIRLYYQPINDKLVTHGRSVLCEFALIVM